MNKKGFELVYWFHGHSCPMSTLGYRAALLAKKLLKVKRKDYHKVSAKLYFKSCAIDGVQIGFPATYANGNLFLQDENIFCFEFFDNEKNRSVMITFNKTLLDFMEEYAQIKKIEKSKRKIKNYFKKFISFTQKASLDEIFLVKEINL